MDPIPFTPPSIESLNELLPAYDFTHFIAQGGMGAVYRATQKSLDREVAIKILPRELGQDPEFRASFQTEARAMAKLNHPNLIGIYDSGDVDGMLYIAMEYVAGKSLYHSSWNKKIDPAQAKKIIVAICDGLSHAHENGIIHRDIKPANILLTPKTEPKIGDFGLAQTVGVKFEGVVMGTPGYTAPEILTHPEKADRRSDIFAVGVMLYELLTGKLPEGNSVPSKLCSCPKEYDAIYLRATHPNPGMRYPEVKAMGQALEAIDKAAVGNKLKVGNTAGSARGSRMVLPAAAKAAAAGNVILHDDDDDRELPTMPVLASSASHWPFVRNMLIIAGLLVVCVFVYQKLQIHKDNVAKQETEGSKQDTVKVTAPVKTDVPEVKPEPPKVETAMEQLRRMRFSLSKGDRESMPKGCKRRGDLDYFLVTEEMTWDEALHFAEEHGAHVAIPHNEDEITFFTSMLKNDETIWLGGGKGGREQWLLLDGEPWPFDKSPAGSGSFATLSYLGLMQASKGNTPRPFLIAWHRDGSNPCSLKALLAMTRKSLDSQNPVYPLGTLVFGSRNFLPVLRKMSFLEAQALATQAGAHIAALSRKDEGYWLEDNLGEVKAPDGIWLNGIRKGSVWQWGTNETWTYAKWADDNPSDDSDAAHLAYIPKKGWVNLPSDEEIGGVLLEWSSDAKSSGGSVTGTLQTGSPDVAALVTKARAAALSARKERDDKVAANHKTFNWDLDLWFRQLKPFQQTRWKEVYEAVKDASNKGRIVAAEEMVDEEGDVPALHQGMVKVHTYGFEKQKEIDAAYVIRIEKLRDAYVAKIKEFGHAAQNSGQQDVVNQLKELLEDTEDAEKWADELNDE